MILFNLYIQNALSTDEEQLHRKQSRVRISQLNIGNSLTGKYPAIRRARSKCRSWFQYVNVRFVYAKIILFCELFVRWGRVAGTRGQSMFHKASGSPSNASLITSYSSPYSS